MHFDLICQQQARLTEILETFLRVFCFPKSRIKENGGNLEGLNLFLHNLNHSFLSYLIHLINETLIDEDHLTELQILMLVTDVYFPHNIDVHFHSQE